MPRKPTQNDKKSVITPTAKIGKAKNASSKVSEYPRSYRFDPEVIAALNKTLERINLASPKKVSEARFIRGLIFLSKDIETEQLIKYIKEAW